METLCSWTLPEPPLGLLPKPSVESTTCVSIVKNQATSWPTARKRESPIYDMATKTRLLLAEAEGVLPHHEDVAATDQTPSDQICNAIPPPLTLTSSRQHQPPDNGIPRLAPKHLRLLNQDYTDGEGSVNTPTPPETLLGLD
jgi:hypothetical protein